MIPLTQVFSFQLFQTETEKIVPYELKNRVSALFGIGVGIQKTDLFLLTTGEKSGISFGGGVSFGMSYGYFIFPSLELSVEGAYQFSELLPIVDNADATVKRFTLSLTPFYVWRFKPESEWRLKVGAGYTYFSSPTFKIEGGSIPGGFNDTWEYEGNSGFHVICLYEGFISKNYTYHVGGKYYKTSYKFTSGKSYTPVDPNLITPDGSGIDFIFTANLYF